MRRRLLRAVVSVCALVVAAATAGAEQMSVAVKTASLRDRPSFTGKIVGTLAYTDRVTVEETRGDWLRVSYAPKSVQGWVTKASLQTQAIALASGSAAAGTTASSGEVALAGKGFSEEVEAEYRKDTKLDYAAVDAMEAYHVAPEAVAVFVNQGDLSVNGETP
jgi:uncharacterized protein YgiM (DUF1202 family)